MGLNNNQETHLVSLINHVGEAAEPAPAAYALYLTSLLLAGGTSSASMLDTDGAASPHKDSHAAENAPASAFSRHSST